MYIYAAAELFVSPLTLIDTHYTTVIKIVIWKDKPVRSLFYNLMGEEILIASPTVICTHAGSVSQMAKCMHGRASRRHACQPCLINGVGFGRVVGLVGLGHSIGHVT